MQLPIRDPKSLHLSIAAIKRADERLRAWTTGANPPIPGAAFVLCRNGGMIEPKYYGRQGPERDAGAIHPQGMFLIASITKPITYMGAMMLVERGELNLSDPVARYIPDFAAHHKEDILVQHLFTHTSGMPDMLTNNVELRKQQAPLRRFIDGAIRDTIPLFRPGTNLSYQSMGTLVVAELVQRISGLTIHNYLKKEIFDPLGLKSTGLGSIGLNDERLVRVETPPYQTDNSFSWNGKYWKELGVPWGGLFTSPADLAVILQLFLEKGSYGGIRLLSPSSVEMMTTNRLNDYAELPESIRRTQPWGLGWRMNHPGTKSSWSDLLSRNAWGHTGATGTMAWVDPDKKGMCILFTTAIRSKAPWRLVQLSNILASAFI